MTAPSEDVELALFADLVERFDHVSMGVHDIAATLQTVALMGGEFHDGGINEDGRFRWAQFRLPGNGKLELIAPLPGNTFLVRFLEARGEGVHHLTFKVRDLSQIITRAGNEGLATLGYHRSPTWSEVFVHPSSANGVVLQFAEWDDSTKVRAESLGAVLAMEP